ncbi:SprT family protein [Lederbergia citrea]|uniref:Protein SprT-like n=1 Tax=Lederbergia citrea TaxID=2833581 RepID=A0A942URQ4_9BACI|nr:SprT family protein [Lederbergia citrea]MBS4178599.1 SprT family protein [Lederbergia citrea]MBS4205287.1 SprT family protein [Lederbergia citrea]MBS4224402.1 SprT family protein [Lederbergia citrea]
MTNDELQALTEKISNGLFKKPFKHKAMFNPRLRTTGGRYLLSSHNIEINRKYYEEHGSDELEGIIKHELCHYHLHIEGKGYKHRDEDFRRLMKKVGAPRHCTPLASSQSKRLANLYIYKCKNCSHQYERQRRVNTKRYVCGKCSGRLVDITKMIQ